MNVYIVERIDKISWIQDYKAIVISVDEKHAERYARWNIQDFKKAKLKITKVNLETEQIISIENTGA